MNRVISKNHVQIFFDIETAPTSNQAFMQRIADTTDPPKALKKQESIDKWIINEKPEAVIEAIKKTALDPLYGEVLLIGVKRIHGNYHFFGGYDEKKVLTMFWESLKKFKSFQLIGFNSNSFDIPFLLKRSLINGIDRHLYWDVWDDIMNYKPKNLIDLRHIFNCGDKYAKGKLDDLVEIFNLPKYTGPASGKTFAEWFEKDKDEAVEYNKFDVLQVQELAKIMGIAWRCDDAC